MNNYNKGNACQETLGKSICGILRTVGIAWTQVQWTEKQMKQCQRVLHISYRKYKFRVLKRVSKIEKQQSAGNRDEKGNCNCLGFQTFKQTRITFLSNREIEEWKAWGNGILWFKNSLAQGRTAMLSMEGAVQLQDHFCLTGLGACARAPSSSSIPNPGTLMERCRWGQRAKLCN